MVKEVKLYARGYSFEEYEVIGENLTENEVNNIPTIRSNSPFGNIIRICNNGTVAKVKCYTD